MSDDREYLEEERKDPRLRLKRLKTRAKALEKDESYWSIADSLELLFRSADLLIELVNAAGEGAAKAAESLEGIFDAIALLLDGLG